MTYILIIIISSHYSDALHSIEFNTKDACQIAKTELIDSNTKTLCVAKGKK